MIESTPITWEPSIWSPQEKARLRKLYVDTFLVTERIMAVDIGNKGGFCCNCGHIFVTEMPEDVNLRWKVFNDQRPSTVVAENVHAFKGQGIVSTGTLLKNRGQVEMAAAALGVKMVFIQPLAWIECYTMKRKKHFKPSKAERLAGAPIWKEHLVEICLAVLPECYHYLVNDKTADAILIWNFFAAQKIGQPLKKMGSQLSFKL